MLIKYDSYVSKFFYHIIGQKNIFYNTKTGILFYRNFNKLQELPNQKRNLVKLERILKDYTNDSGHLVDERSIKLLKKQNTRHIKEKERKTRKSRTFFGF